MVLRRFARRPDTEDEKVYQMLSTQGRLPKPQQQVLWQTRTGGVHMFAGLDAWLAMVQVAKLSWMRF